MHVTPGKGSIGTSMGDDVSIQLQVPLHILLLWSFSCRFCFRPLENGLKLQQKHLSRRKDVRVVK